MKTEAQWMEQYRLIQDMRRAHYMDVLDGYLAEVDLEKWASAILGKRVADLNDCSLEETRRLSASMNDNRKCAVARRKEKEDGVG